MPKLKPVGSSGNRGKGFSTSSTSLNRTTERHHHHQQQDSPTSFLHHHHNNNSNQIHHQQESYSINSSYNNSGTQSLNVSGSSSPASIHMSLSNKPPPPPPPPSNLKPSLSSVSQIKITNVFCQASFESAFNNKLFHFINYSLGHPMNKRQLRNASQSTTANPRWLPNHLESMVVSRVRSPTLLPSCLVCTFLHHLHSQLGIWWTREVVNPSKQFLQPRHPLVEVV